MFRNAAASTFLLIAAGAPALAQSQPPQPVPAATLPEVSVIGTTPVLGAGTPKDQVPAAVQVLTPQDIARTGIPSLSDALNATNSSVHLNDLSGNPFQPDVLFRGFTASPVEGETQGLAVYVNGARFNSPFGDTVNWDLIPSNAIAQVNVEGGNPVFGLNALGGSVAVKMKDGFTFHGGDATIYGGSYGRAAGLFEYGAESGNTSAYIAADLIHDSGWRKTSNSEVRQVYTDLGWRNNSSEVHVNITAADNNLGNPGATPVDLLSIDRTANSTAPNTVSNHYVALNLNGTHDITDDTSVQAVLYVSNLSQRSNNGNTVSFADCGTLGGTSGLLCAPDGTVALDPSGNQIPSTMAGANGYSGLVLSGIDTTGYGGSVQVTNQTDLAGHHNRLVVGVSADAGDTSFESTQYVGGLTANRWFAGPQYALQFEDSEGDIFAPVSLKSYNQYYGAYISDRFELTDRLALNFAGRYNTAQVAVHDRDNLFGSLTTNASYSRFDPGVGLTWRVAPPVSVFANYSEANRAPTPNEIECTNQNQACSLPNAYISDPPGLKQVVARTVELGARGRLPDVLGGRLTFDGDFYRTENADDIVFQYATDSNAGGFFTNVGRTLRQGLEATLNWRTARTRVSLGYTFTDATYQSSFTENAGSNPNSTPCPDGSGNQCIVVNKGNHLPLVPQNRATLTVDFNVTDRWTVGGSLVAQTSEYLFGDDANTNKQLGGYVVANLNTAYRITDYLDVFGVVNNITDGRYNTYGTFVDVGSIDQSFTNPRVYSPGAPIAGYVGLRARF